MQVSSSPKIVESWICSVAATTNYFLQGLGYIPLGFGRENPELHAIIFKTKLPGLHAVNKKLPRGSSFGSILPTHIWP